MDWYALPEPHSIPITPPAPTGNGAAIRRDSMQIQQEEYTQPQPRKGARPELILGLIALVCAAGLIAMAVLCIPYYHRQPAPTQHTAAETTAETSVESEPMETTEVTIPPESNPYTSRDFQYNRHNYLLCTKQVSYPGVDVSAFQGNIDWKQVAGSGIRFAMVRLGYRGWGKAGNMVVDENAKKNLKGAKEAGLSVGAYFFSQALTLEEVDAEIKLLTEVLGDTQLDMPLVLDWEPISEEGSRSKNMDRRTLTDLLLYFCQVMKNRGYQPMIYFNPNDANKLLYLNELEEYPFWLAYYTDRMNYRFRVEMWQYSNQGRVPGISTDVDLNLYMPNPKAN